MEIIATLTNTGTDPETLEALAKQLEQDGYTVDLTGNLLSIEYDPGKAKARRSRGAGRK